MRECIHGLSWWVVYSSFVPYYSILHSLNLNFEIIHCIIIFIGHVLGLQVGVGYMYIV